MHYTLSACAATLPLFLSACSSPATLPTLPACEGVAPPSGGELLADSCFRPSSDAFSFANYTDGLELTPTEMVQVFGTGVCSRQRKTCPELAQGQPCQEPCLLTPQAQQHMDEYNRWLAGGRCDGLSAMSQLIHEGFTRAADFGAPSTFELSKTDGVERQIARWWATQIPVQHRGAYQTLGAKGATAFLIDVWAHESMATLWISYLSNGSMAAHALTPYAITSMPDGTQRLYVYDSNTPGEERFITLQPASDGWEYEVKKGELAGAAASPEGYNQMRFVVDEARVLRYCWFCDDSFADAVQDYVTLGGDAAVKLEDDAGKLVDKAADGIWSAVGASIDFPLISTDERPLPTVRHDVITPYRLVFTGPTQAEPSRFLVSSPGRTVGMTSIELGAGEQGVATIHPDTNEIDYLADGSDNVTFYAGDTTATADYELTFKLTTRPGHKVHLTNAEATETLVVSLEAPDDLYQPSLTIARAKNDAIDKATFQIPPYTLAELTIRYSNFTQELSVDIDINKDGSVDSTMTIPPSPPL